MNSTGSDPKRPHLSVVLEDSGADRRAPVARWVITLSEPLVSTPRRAAADEAMVKFIARNSHWATAWFAGFLCDVAATLPPEDPWRRLSASIDLNTISSRSADDSNPETLVSFESDGGAKAPATTGAVRHDGQRFGSLSDSTDMVMGELGAADLDLGLAAVAEDIDDLTAAIIGFSVSNHEAMESVLAKIYHHLWMAEFDGDNDDARPASEVFFEVVSEALRRLIHRRRGYTGGDDPFPAVAGFAWMARADRIVGGKRNIASEVGLARDARIDPGTYDDMNSY